MQKPVRLIIVLALIGLGFGAWRLVYSSPNHIIRSKLQQLAKTASLTPKDGNFVRVYKIEHLPEFFTRDVVINVDLRGIGQTTIEGRDEVRQYVNAAFSPQGLGELKTQFRDVSVTLAPDKQSAVANLTGEFTVDGQHDFFVVELNLLFKKVEGEWLIYKIETVRTLAAL